MSELAVDSVRIPGVFRLGGKPWINVHVFVWVHYCAFAVALFTLTASLAATKSVDLDANPANGAESQCDLNVFQTFPVQFENKVTNKTGGDAFSFTWPSAGPGGFS